MKNPRDILSGRGSRLVAAAVSLAIASSLSIPGYAEESAGGQDLTEIVVTGSRIVRKDYESQTPIVTLNAETFENRSAVTVESALQQLPQFAPSAGAQSNSGSSTPFPSPTAAPGAATVNLRGLGTNRNLILIDGRRVQPSSGNMTVDLNTIPSNAIQNVEVISGGAAAVYGADAISGVINFITRKNFEGAQFDAQYGITQEGDGEQYSFSALLGTNYADGRGNVMFGGNYAYRGDIASKNRDWVRAGWKDPGTNAGGAGNAAGISLFRCARTPVNTCSTSAWLPVLNGSGYSVDQNGNVFDASDPLNPGHPYTGPVSYESGFKLNPNGTLGYFDKDNAYLSVPLERYSLFATTNYKFNDHVEMFTDARFTQSYTVARGTHVSLFNIWAMNVPYNQAYDDPDSPTFGQAPAGTAMHPVSSGLADVLNARNVANPTTSPWLYEGGVDYLPAYRTETTTNIYQLVAGLRGDLPFKDWTWEVYGSHGNTNVNAYLPESFLSMANTQVLFSANQYGAGWTNPQTLTVAGSCTSGLPIFNPDGTVNNTPSVSQNCADWVTLRMNNVTNLEQEMLEATVQGTMFEGWAGPVQFAAGVDYRAEDFKFTPDGAYSAEQATANVVNNIALPLGVNGQNHVSEAYAELAIPVLTDLPFVKKLEIDPGYRISDYKTSGSISTWKVTGAWEVVDWFSLRGGYQKATRAPNLNELFMPTGAASIQTSIDGCGNWTGWPAWANVQGNPNRVNVQTLCQYLMVRDGAPANFPLYVPGPGNSADSYAYTVFGANNPNAAFGFDLGIQGGNPDLKPETANTTTIGAVLKSPFEHDLLRRMTLSVDYYNIDLKGAIAVPTGGQVYQQCLDAKYNPLIGDAAGSHSGAELAAGNPYCALISREYTGTPSGSFGADRRYSAKFVNLGGIKTSGYDVQLDWAANLGPVPGTFTTNIQYNHLNEFKQSPFAGAAFTERKGTWDAGYNYDWQLLTTLGYVNGPYSLGLRWSHKPGLNPPSSSAASALPVASYDLFDMFGRWAISKRYEVRAGIDNLLNKDPGVFGASRVLNTDGTVNTAASNNALGSSVVGQDTFGRRFYVAVKVSL
jgi:outer membrane receptor protein involved in Fe transport